MSTTPASRTAGRDHDAPVGRSTTRRVSTETKQAWLYATILTTGYMISRGLAKSGSREPYDDNN